MTPPTDPAATPPTEDAPPSRSLLDRVPRRLFRGRVRTTTAVLVIVFIGLLALYGQRSDHYTKLDEQAAAASASRAAAIPRTTATDTPEYTEPTRTSTRTSSSTPPSTSGTTSSGTTTDPNNTGTVPTTTTTAPGFQFPTIPGVVLPGQTPTTTPVR